MFYDYAFDPPRVKQERFREEESGVEVAAVQMEPLLLEKESNLGRCLEYISACAEEGARLVVLPECVLTGIMFDSLEEAGPLMESVPGRSTDTLARACMVHKVYVVAGMLEAASGRHYNTAVLVGPRGLIGRYRKTHLPFLGVDRFLDHGDAPPEVYETEIGKIGMGICYDILFPEHARTLALKGAEIFALPTNWPQQRVHIPEYVVPARAAENRMFVIAANRVGVERGTRFLGRSIIAHCAAGEPLARGSLENEEVLYARIDRERARQKHVVIAPGQFEFDLVRDRRPELYGLLTKPVEASSTEADA
ncbi:MAG: carbon-nitrogen hydrolase family protein [Dehalococcoidia bacterium]|nr:carbon-nitrogen hydrolase family protein [Dehalococcoidia bacterium]